MNIKETKELIEVKELLIMAIGDYRKIVDAVESLSKFIAEHGTTDTGLRTRFPISVKLVGEDGNAFSILGRVRAALKVAGATPEELDEYVRQATSGDYYELLAVTGRWVNVH